jgi:hypothetical protein
VKLFREPNTHLSDHPKSQFGLHNTSARIKVKEGGESVEAAEQSPTPLLRLFVAELLLENGERGLVLQRLNAGVHDFHQLTGFGAQICDAQRYEDRAPQRTQCKHHNTTHTRRRRVKCGRAGAGLFQILEDSDGLSERVTIDQKKGNLQMQQSTGGRE